MCQQNAFCYIFLKCDSGVRSDNGDACEVFQEIHGYMLTVKLVCMYTKKHQYYHQPIYVDDKYIMYAYE